MIIKESLIFILMQHILSFSLNQTIVNIGTNQATVMGSYLNTHVFSYKTQHIFKLFTIDGYIIKTINVKKLVFH